MSEHRLPNIAGHWTEAQTMTCIEAWRGGESSRDIGNRIGKSRNAVIGKMGRLHIEQGKPPPAPILRGMQEPEPQPEPPPEPIDYVARICGCGGPVQPGRGLCASCINKRKKPNPRAAMWVGVGGAA